MPFSEYARRYTPTDRIGFGATSEQPSDTVSPELTRFAQLDRRMHERFTLGTLGPAVFSRVATITRGTWYYAGLPVVLLVAAGMGLPNAIFRLVLGTILLVFASYLLYGHLASWTVYYLEIQAPLAFLTAVGVFVVADRLSTATSVSAWAVRDRLGMRRLLVVVGGIVLLAPGAAEARAWREAHVADRALVDAFEAAIGTLPRHPAIAFVRENSDAHPERTVVDNVVNLRTAALWVVHDRGVDNQRLATLDSGRTPYLLNEERDNGLVRFRVSELSNSLTSSSRPAASSSSVLTAKPRRDRRTVSER
jgi:hypothetical protein